MYQTQITVSNNLKSMNEINARSKTIILHNIKEIIHDNKNKYDEELSIKIIKMHRIGKIDIDKPHDKQLHA